MPGQGHVIAQRYRLEEEIAAGATGRAWRAMDEQHRRPVTVTMLRRDYARSPVIRERFREAARQAAAVSHKGVARIYDYGEDGPFGAPYLVTELIQGPSLAAVISGGGTRASVIAMTLSQVADGLHAGHLAGLVHGDLKPASILFRSWPERRPAVTDFGIAHAVGPIPRAAQGTGTALYLAPERVSGEPGTPASDLYSLGIVAYEWLAGTPPFTGTPRQVMTAHLREPLPGLPAAVPPALAELVARLTAKDLAERYEDASLVAAVARAVARELREEEDGSVLFPLASQDAPALHASPEEPAAGEPEPARDAAQGTSRLPGLGTCKREIAWAAAALVLGGVIGWAAWGPVQSAVRITQLAIPPAASPGRIASQRPAMAPGRGGSGNSTPEPPGYLGRPGPAEGTSRAASPGPGKAGRGDSGPGDGTATGSGGPGLSPSTPRSPSAPGAGARHNGGPEPTAGPVPNVSSQPPVAVQTPLPMTPATTSSLPPWIPPVPFLPVRVAPFRPPFPLRFPFAPAPGQPDPAPGPPGLTDPPGLPGHARHFAVPLSIPGL